jgi:hypothetical protein
MPSSFIVSVLIETYLHFHEVILSHLAWHCFRVIFFSWKYSPCEAIQPSPFGLCDNGSKGPKKPKGDGWIASHGEYFHEKKMTLKQCQAKCDRMTSWKCKYVSIRTDTMKEDGMSHCYFHQKCAKREKDKRFDAYVADK